MLIGTAYAQTPAAPVAEPSPFAGLLPIILLFAIMYFLLIRPQQKKLRDHRQMVSALRKGDKVMTAGGILGTIVKVDEEVATVEIAPELRVKVSKPTIASVITRSEPADGKTAAND